jgi:membrane protein
VLGLWGVFGELQDGLNTIWGVTPKAGRRVRDIVKERFWSFAMVVGTGFLLLVSLVVTAWLAAVSTYVSYLLPAPALALEALNSVISLAVITVAFAVIFKLLPDVKGRLARCLAGSRGHLAALHPRQVPHRPLSRQERGGFGVWGRRLPRHHRGLGLLLRADPPLRRRVHQGRGPSAAARASRSRRWRSR